MFSMEGAEEGGGASGKSRMFKIALPIRILHGSIFLSYATYGVYCMPDRIKVNRLIGSGWPMKIQKRNI